LVTMAPSACLLLLTGMTGKIADVKRWMLPRVNWYDR
jgi:hypothetical protein